MICTGWDWHANHGFSPQHFCDPYPAAQTHELPPLTASRNGLFIWERLGLFIKPVDWGQSLMSYSRASLPLLGQKAIITWDLEHQKSGEVDASRFLRDTLALPLGPLPGIGRGEDPSRSERT